MDFIAFIFVVHPSYLVQCTNVMAWQELVSHSSLLYFTFYCENITKHVRHVDQGIVVDNDRIDVMVYSHVIKITAY